MRSTTSNSASSLAGVRQAVDQLTGSAILDLLYMPGFERCLNWGPWVPIDGKALPVVEVGSSFTFSRIAPLAEGPRPLGLPVMPAAPFATWQRFRMT